MVVFVGGYYFLGEGWEAGVADSQRYTLSSTQSGFTSILICNALQGAELQVTVSTELENGLGTTRMVHWAGAALQEPHRAVKSLNFMPKEGNGVYISR